MNIVILGPQGSGKGTQAELLAKKYGLEHVDMGKTLREIAKFDSPLGKEIYRIQNVTKTLVPSRILKGILHLKLNSLPREQGVIFEGVPRTTDQQEYLEKELKESGRKIDAVVFINIPEEESIKRIGKRWTCKKCGLPLIMGVDIKKSSDICPKCGGETYQRLDDTPEGVRKRLEVFRKETMSVVEYYRKRGILIEIDGRASIEEVSRNILSSLSRLKGE
jgi:adenylate kinase